MKKILVIGKRGFIGNNLAKYLKQTYSLKHIRYKDLKKHKSQLNSFDFIINTSTNKNYIKKKYNEKFDNDLKIANLISKLSDGSVYCFAYSCVGVSVSADNCTLLIKQFHE